MKHLVETASIIPSLCYIVIIIAIAGFGLATPGLRGKVWLAIWGVSPALNILWYVMLEVLRTTEIIRSDTYEKFMVANALVNSLNMVGWACLLFFIASQRPGNTSNFGRVLLTINGRATRLQFWVVTIALEAIICGCGGLWLIEYAKLNNRTSFGSLDTQQTSTRVAAVVFFFWTLVCLWPRIAVQMKRWHDRGRSGAMVLINFIPVVGPIWSLIELGFLPGTRGANAYGANPLQAIAATGAQTTAQIYLYLSDQQVGPYSIDQVRQLLASGQIAANTHAWRDGSSDWVPVTTILAGC